MTKTRIDRNTEVTVQSNIHASFVYSEGGVSLELAGYGDEDFLTFGELKKLSSGSSKNVLRNMYLLITDVDSLEFTVDDVVRQLKLEKYYSSAKKSLSMQEDKELAIENFVDFVEDASATEATKAIDENPNLKEVLVQNALILYKERTIDIDKIQKMLESCGVDSSKFYAFLEDLSLSEE